MKENKLIANKDIKAFISGIEVNKMYELPKNSDFKWVMIERNEMGYCWTLGCKGICTTMYSSDTENNIKYWKTEEEAKNNLIERIATNRQV